MSVRNRNGGGGGRDKRREGIRIEKMAVGEEASNEIQDKDCAQRNGVFQGISE